LSTRYEVVAGKVPQLCGQLIDPIDVGELEVAVVAWRVLQDADDGSSSSAPGLATSDALGSKNDGHWRFEHARA